MEEGLEVKFGRDINCLREKDKNVRINSLKRLQQNLLKENPEVVSQLFAGKLKSPLLDLLKDPTDKCKELSLEILSQVLTKKYINTEDVPFIVKAIHSRVGVEPCQETCEEVRISEMSVLQIILDKYLEIIQPILSDITDVLYRLGKDKCPQVKNQVAASIIFIAKNGLRFGSKKLLDGIRANANHQQFKVRSLTLEAFGALCLHDSGISEELYMELKKAQVDRRQEVRLKTYSVVHEILMHLSYAELVKIEGKFVYLLLGGMSDEECCDQVLDWFREVALRIYNKAQEYSPEGLEDFSDDWLVVRNMSSLVNTSLGDIQEWTIQDFYRSRAVNNIRNIILYGKSSISPYIETVFKVLFNAYSSSNDSKYSELIEQIFLSIPKNCELAVVLSAYEKLTQETLAVSEKSAGIKLLSFIIQSLSHSVKDLGQVVDFLFLQDFVSEYSLHYSLLFPLSSLVNNFQSKCAEYINEIFYILLTLENTQKDQSSFIIQTLSDFCGYSSVSDLYSIELPITLPKILKNYKNWESSSFERTQFKNLIIRAGQGASEFWEEILPVLKENCSRDKESEVRYDMLAVLEAFSLCQPLYFLLSDSSEDVLNSLITPTCSWKVGASSVQIRISSLLCLNNLLRQNLLKSGVLNKNWDKFFSSFAGCLDDDWDSELRITALQAVGSLVNCYLSQLDFPAINGLIKEVIKRLDDSVDGIRIMASNVLPDLFREALVRGLELEDLDKQVKVLTLHLDDENENLRNGVMKILIEIGGLRKETVLGIVKEKRGKQRNVKALDELIERVDV